jgi:ribosomal protein L12E/L44/L45/RPP1/RPP2
MAARSIDIMKKFAKTHKILIIVILVLVATVSTILGVNAYNNYQDKKSINSSLSNISQINKKFDSETDRAKKLTILENIEKGFTNYKKSRKVFNEVSIKYTSEISKMKKCFTDEYDKTIEKNTISDVSTIDDKTVLSSNVSNLQAEGKLVADEVNYVCNSNQVNTYTTKINTLVDSYNNRIKAIEDAEAAAKAKADAEAAAAAKKAAEEAAAQKANADKNNGSGNNGTGNKTAVTDWYTTPTGAKIPAGWYESKHNPDATTQAEINMSTLYFYKNGDIYDNHGRKIKYKFDQGDVPAGWINHTYEYVLATGEKISNSDIYSYPDDSKCDYKGDYLGNQSDIDD